MLEGDVGVSSQQFVMDHHKKHNIVSFCTHSCGILCWDFVVVGKRRDAFCDSIHLTQICGCILAGGWCTQVANGELLKHSQHTYS